jgi:hypothetical protein
MRGGAEKEEEDGAVQLSHAWCRMRSLLRDHTALSLVII